MVTKTYVPSGLGGNMTYLAHSKNPRPSTSAPSNGLHLPWISTPLTVVLTTYSSASS